MSDVTIIPTDERTGECTACRGTAVSAEDQYRRCIHFGERAVREVMFSLRLASSRTFFCYEFRHDLINGGVWICTHRSSTWEQMEAWVRGEGTVRISNRYSLNDVAAEYGVCTR